LFEGTTRFDALMLADIADQKHAIIGTKPERNSRIWLVLARLDSSTR
jgi:hypothetical protein